jgi:hypothetical protein
MAAAAAAREVDLRKARRDGVVGMVQVVRRKRSFFSPVQKNDDRKRQATPVVL